MTTNTVFSVNSLSVEDKKKVRSAISEMNDSMTRVSAEQELQKQILQNLHDAIGVDKKMVRKMAKAYYKANFNEEVVFNQNFEDWYNIILKTN